MLWEHLSVRISLFSKKKKKCCSVDSINHFPITGTKNPTHNLKKDIFIFGLWFQSMAGQLQGRNRMAERHGSGKEHRDMAARKYRRKEDPGTGIYPHRLTPVTPPHQLYLLTAQEHECLSTALSTLYMVLGLHFLHTNIQFPQRHLFKRLPKLYFYPLKKNRFKDSTQASEFILSLFVNHTNYSEKCIYYSCCNLFALKLAPVEEYPFSATSCVCVNSGLSPHSSIVEKHGNLAQKP